METQLYWNYPIVSFSDLQSCSRYQLGESGKQRNGLVVSHHCCLLQGSLSYFCRLSLLQLIWGKMAFPCFRECDHESEWNRLLHPSTLLCVPWSLFLLHFKEDWVYTFQPLVLQCRVHHSLLMISLLYVNGLTDLREHEMMLGQF